MSDFAGFAPANTTPVPDILFDELLSVLSGAEIKVLLYIIRRTSGFKKTSDSISFTQFEEGITTKEGKVLDKGCGLSRETISKALKSLESRGCITSTKSKTARNDNEVTVYALCFKEVVGKSDQGSTEIRLPVVGKTDQGSRKNPKRVVGKTDPQETVSQQTDKQETVSQSVSIDDSSGQSKEANASHTHTKQNDENNQSMGVQIQHRLYPFIFLDHPDRPTTLTLLLGDPDDEHGEKARVWAAHEIQSDLEAHLGYRLARITQHEQENRVVEASTPQDVNEKALTFTSAPILETTEPPDSDAVLNPTPQGVTPNVTKPAKAREKAEGPIGPPQAPPTDMAWGTKKCLLLFDYWRGAQLIGLGNLKKASSDAKGLASQYTEEQVAQVYKTMNDQDYWKARGGADLCNVANNISKEINKIKPVQATLQTATTTQMDEAQARLLATRAVALASTEGHEIKAVAMLKGEKWVVVVDWDTKYFEKPETFESESRYIGALKEMCQVWNSAKKKQKVS
jgi:DNA-binding MarR family transcriptional regulator